jgi:arylsulfatase A-like enzyme
LSAPKRTARPNIVVIVADDHRHDCLSSIHPTGARTPVLDGLAAGGAQFRGARIVGGANAAVCVPSRAALHTGCAPHEALVATAEPMHNSTNGIRPSRVVLGEAFRAAGYTTFATGKWHNDPAAFNRAFAGGEALLFGGMAAHIDPPLQDYDPSGEYPADRAQPRPGFSTELFADAAIRFLDRQTADEPFLLSIAFTSPHDPRTPPPEWRALYDETGLPLPPNFLPKHPFDNGELDVRDEQLAARPREAAEIRHQLADYYGMISHHDAQIGRVLEALERRGLRDHTIIAYVSDHGLGLGQHGLMGKQNVYEHSLRVPLILNGPGVPGGCVVDRAVYSFQLYPTLCELAGVARPDSVMSDSLGPLLAGWPTSDEEPHFAHYRERQAAVRLGRWKLLEYYPPADARHQLFDLETDPWEMADRSADPDCAEQLAALHTLLTNWRREQLRTR